MRVVDSFIIRTCVSLNNNAAVRACRTIPTRLHPSIRNHMASRRIVRRLLSRRPETRGFGDLAIAFH